MGSCVLSWRTLGFDGRPAAEHGREIWGGGEAPGRWRVMEMDDEGRSGTLLFEGLDLTGLSVHPRGTSFFAFGEDPMEPVRRALSQLEINP